MTPGELLDRLGVPWSQTTDPAYGYSGSFTPRCAFGHWSASAAGSDTSTDVLWARCYHAAVSRSGVVKLGGWQVRQGHGGEGRTTPMRLAVSGSMSLDALRAWQASGQVDDTSSAPNQYGYGVCLDNNGVGEPVSDVQWYAWCAAMATFVILAGGSSVGSVIDHSASTNRKIDLSGSPAIAVDRWWADIATHLDVLQKGPAAVTNFCVGPPAVHPDGSYAQVTELGFVYVSPAPGSKARYHGGMQDAANVKAGARCTGIAWTPDGDGYYVNTTDGYCTGFGDAPDYGSAQPDMVPG